MPMFQPSKKDVGFEDGRILDLDTAVKDGVLGGLPHLGYGCGLAEKSDLKKMIEELNLPEVPSVFICPISLEPMQDPVTLCTGQTYEKSNILKWFSLGHHTCPTTMQELWDSAVTPNRTLCHLIDAWFSQKYVQMKKRSEDAQGQATELLTSLKKVKGQARIQSLKELRQVVGNHSTARKTIVDESGVALLSSLLGPFTSYAVGSEVIAILVNLTLSHESKTNLMQPAKVSSIVDILNEGSVETKINCVRLIDTLTGENDFGTEIVASHSLLVALMRLVRDRRHPHGHLPALGCLKLICTHKQVGSLMVTVGAVPQLIELILGLNPECTDLALFILDALSSVPEGRQALKDCSNTISIMVKLLMRLSESSTGYVLSILLTICQLYPEECSLVAVDASLAAKLLLVIQSGCSPVLKQRAAELLKLCSLNCSDTIFISKCKLTRTIQ
ncbi:U-box domain-containing protein 30-like [Dorcoceras hygrometricum]|uniref:U-box domain-containing protein n=1 Tax=Dorcoceras hygrometricum TaxID=472368 RepID=A0A2Z7AQN1_9LAMI|nr:U-box domain-containing protein 30-like [Dorcoceras hygrometricum]